MKTIWITRSQPSAGELAQRLQAEGFATVIAPMIEVETFTSPLVQVNGHRVDNPATVLEIRPKLLIVLSAHAARGFVHSEIFTGLPNLPYVAVGEQTAAVLRDTAGLQVEVPELATSEGVLTVPLVTTLAAGDSVWLLAGVGGREILAQHLQDELRCRVVKLELYRRRDRRDTPEVVTDTIDAVEIASMQGLQVFYTHWTKLAGNMAVPLIVPSARVAQGAQALGFTRIITAKGASADAVLAVLTVLKQGTE